MMRRTLALLALSLFAAACSSSNDIPIEPQLMEAGPGSPVEIRLAGQDTGGVGMTDSRDPQFIKLKIEVSNISRNDIRVRRIAVHQELEGAIRVRPNISGFDVTIPPGGEHVFDIGLVAEMGDPTIRSNALNLRAAVHLDSGEGYYSSLEVGVPNLRR